MDSAMLKYKLASTLPAETGQYIRREGVNWESAERPLRRRGYPQALDNAMLAMSGFHTERVRDCMHERGREANTSTFSQMLGATEG